MYDFPKTEKFSGRNFYNPYENISGNSYKANLHCHSRGIFEAQKSTQKTANLEKVYRAKGYSVLAITNHNKITRATSTNKNFLFIPSYEFGQGFLRNHILVIGANHRSYLQFPYIQTIHHKQGLIDNLHDDGQLVSIAHPARSGYELSDMENLSGMNCIEVSNFGHSSTAYWDVLLSNGKPIWLTAGDDSHDITDTQRTFRSWTWIFSDYLTRDSIISALSCGRSYAVSGENAVDNNKLVSCSLYDNLLQIQFEHPADTIRLIGQNGKLLSLVTNSNSAIYIVGKSIKYIRTEAKTGNSTIYLNPIIRFKTDYFPYREIPPIDWGATWLIRSILFLIHFTIFGLLYFSWKKNKKNKLAQKRINLQKK
ncbi:MAG: CehA/McbA family metallohydrolase [bacterium]